MAEYKWPATGGVKGPGSSTTNSIATFADTTGKLLLSSSAIVDGSGNLSLTGILKVPDGLYSSPSVTFTNNSTAGIFNDGGYLGLSPGSGNRFNFYDTSGGLMAQFYTGAGNNAYFKYGLYVPPSTPTTMGGYTFGGGTQGSGVYSTNAATNVSIASNGAQVASFDYVGLTIPNGKSLNLANNAVVNMTGPNAQILISGTNNNNGYINDGGGGNGDINIHGNTQVTIQAGASKLYANNGYTAAINGYFAVYGSTPQIVIGTYTTPTAQTCLDMSPITNAAMRLPLVSGTSTITTPSNGMMIYDTSTNHIKAYVNGAWVTVV